MRKASLGQEEDVAINLRLTGCTVEASRSLSRAVPEKITCPNNIKLQKEHPTGSIGPGIRLKIEMLCFPSLCGAPLNQQVYKYLDAISWISAGQGCL